MTVLIVAVVNDIRFQKIPNFLTITAMIVAVLYNSLLNGLSGFLFSIKGIFIGIVVMIIPYIMGGMGAGDAKLMGAVGGLLGPKEVFIAFLLTALVGGIYAIGMLVYYGGIGESMTRYGQMIKTFFMTGKVNYLPPSANEKKPRMRYGIAIALGTMIAVFIKNPINEILHLI